MIKNLFSNEDTDVYLLSQSDFSSRYKLNTENIFMMGAENPPIKMTNNSIIKLEQIVSRKSVISTIKIEDTACETDNPNFKEALEEAMHFSDIIRTVVVNRNLRGEYQNIANFKNIESSWAHWKQKQLPTIFTNLVKQRKIIHNFENGLQDLDLEFKNNLQYILLLPECYKFRDYSNPKDVSRAKTYKSRLVEDLSLYYQLKKSSFKIEGNNVYLNLVSFINNEYQDKLTTFYKNYLPNFSSEQYKFEIFIQYKLNKQSSKILKTKLSMIEELHPNYNYKQTFILKEFDGK